MTKLLRHPGWLRGAVRLLLFLLSQGSLPAADLLRISEFMAVNDATIPDEEGDFSDWIEIHNAGTSVVNLDGWYLTDRTGDLKQWRFPSTNLAANAYLLVFASGKDRRVPGAPLHTNFKLSSDGEYLALVAPDGTNVVSAYSPIFPVQVSGVSYGMGQVQTTTVLVSERAAGKLLLPSNGQLGQTWTLPGFDDSSWAGATTGVGFERDGRVPFVSSLIADSVAEFSGAQGANNWYYGYWNRSADPDGTYAATDFTPFPNGGGAFGPGNYWNGVSWDWFNGDPPYTELNALGGRPSVSGGPGEPDHLVVRRYVSEFEGPIQVMGVITHTSDWVRVTQTATFPSGVTPLLYLYLAGLGEGYLDDVTVVAGEVPEAGVNLIANGDFEATNLRTRWAVSANLAFSDATTTNPRHGDKSLHIVSTSAGSSQTSAIWQNVAGMTVGQTYTLSYWYLPVTNSAPLVVRFSGSWISTVPEACGDGVVGRIFVDGQEVFQQGAFVSSESYDTTFPVRLGSKVDFLIDPGLTLDNACHAATFTARVRTADPTLAVVADSVADWSVTGAQGEKGWSYGYWNAGTNLPLPAYGLTNFTAFPRGAGPFSTNNFWDGDKWDWWGGDPPADEITQFEMNPNGLNNGPVHWVLRRWISDVSGEVTVDWTLTKPEASGGGVSGRLFHNGVPSDAVTLPGTNAPIVRRSVALSGVQIGDAIDLALDPTGIGGTYGDGGDRCRVSVTIHGRPGLTGAIATDVESTLWDADLCAYLRIPFVVTDPAAIEFLTLRMKYDDGFVAYLNGQRVASANAPPDPQYNSPALQPRSDAEALVFEDFDLTAWRGLLVPGTNVLAIQGMNVSVTDNDFLILPQLLGTRIEADTTSGRYFTEPTPGAGNGSGSTTLGPVVREVAHAPLVPSAGQDLVVTARLQATLAPVGAVQLAYRVMYSNEVVLPMLDDGRHGDGAAGDGLYGATLPAGAAGPGQMVRYYVFASDTGSHTTRLPAFEDPQGSPEYFGTVVRDPTLTNGLPVLQMFVRNPTLATNFAGTRCAIFYDDEFYDNVGVNLHGQTTAFVFAKRSMNLDLNRGHRFRWDAAQPRVSAFNLLTPIADKAYVRQLLAYETFTQAGVPSHFAFAVRVQQNQAFYGVFHLVEKGDDHFLERVGLDPEGSLYKVYLPLTNAYAGVVEKKTRQNEPNDDLAGLIEGLKQSGQGLERFVFDHIDVPEVINFLATLQLVQNEDCCAFKNYYLYRDTRGSGEWQMMPWDLDLTFGRTFGFFQVNGVTINGYYNTNIYWTNAYYSQRRSVYDYIGVSQPVVDALFSSTRTFTMFLRRWSTVHDQFLQPINTHPLLNYYERRVDELVAQLGPDAELDFARWGNWAPTQTLATAVQVLKTEYFARRRGWVFNTLRFTNDGPYLSPQPTNTVIRMGAIEFNPLSGNQAEEYLELINPYSSPIDVSGWRVSGGIDYTLRPGVVIPGGGTLYLSPDVKAFRARSTGPRGGQGLFVQGPYQRQLSAWGELLLLSDANGRPVYATNYPGSPSLAQQFLRVTEIMYHPPPPPPGLATNADAFEYLELRNTGPVALDLSHVRFTAGVEFDFTGSAVTNLAPGQLVLVVKNLAAFISRYGPDRNVAGEYAGALDNGGELLRLEDARGEKILEFAYSNSWYPLTDGPGFSLVIQDDEASWELWGQKESWRASATELGSPAGDDPIPPAIPRLLVNEALTRTEPPTVDTVEIHNPTAAPVNLRGWFLSDDFGTPKKYRVATDLFIAAGGYHFFSESDFNAAPGSPASFAFSSLGDEVYLFSGDANATNLTGYVHGFRFGAAETGVSFGRYRTSVGEEHFVAQTAYTPGAANPGPRVGPVVVSEIFFHPPERAPRQDNVQDEFIELHNASDAAVTLFDPARPANTWQVRGAVDFIFPSGVSLAAHRALLLVSFDPSDAATLAEFRARFSVPLDVTVWGPYSGKLDNSGEAIELYRPGVPELATVPSLLVERVAYRDAAPWPTGADGTGASLQRSVLTDYGDDPANWHVGAPSAGALPPGGAPPVVVTQPASQIGLLSQSIAFTVTATGLAPLRYQWMHDGTSIPGATNSALTLSQLRFEDAGNYAVTVYNRTGVTVSSNAALTILLPAYFLSAPQPVRLRGSTNVADYGFTTNSATFSVVAAGNGPIRYQWRFNGNPIPGALGPSLTLPNVDLSNDGLYDVLVTDDLGTIPSPPARLTVLLAPQLVQLPSPQTVVSNGTFTTTVVIRGNPPPFYYSWFEVSAPRGTFRETGRTNFFTSGPVTNLVSRNWRIIVTNEANIVATATTMFPVVALADTDRDGLPDAWETSFGLDPADAADRDLDADGDGVSNLAEYLAGTDPTSPSSYLRIDSLELGNGAEVTFGMASNKTYSVQYTDALGETNWAKLADFLASPTNRVGRVLDPDFGPSRYYRLVTPRRP